MKKLKLIFLGIVGLMLIGCNSEVEQTSPIQIKPKILVGKGLFGNTTRVPVIEIFSIVDSITIKDVIANNGNCRMSVHRQKEFPQSLKYGQKAVAGYTTQCNLLKVEIVTDQGSWIQEFTYIPEEYINM